MVAQWSFARKMVVAMMCFLCTCRDRDWQENEVRKMGESLVVSGGLEFARVAMMMISASQLCSVCTGEREDREVEGERCRTRDHHLDLFCTALAFAIITAKPNKTKRQKSLV